MRGGALDDIRDPTRTPSSDVAEALFSGPGEIRERCRELDWSKSPLGPVESWPVSLRTAVRLCLDSPTAMAVWAGPELVLIYNKGYSKTLGADRHPWALGRPGREVWGGFWDWLGPSLEQVMGGQALHWEDQRVEIERDGRREESFFTYSHVPIREDDGRVVGSLNVVQETTERMRRIAASEQLLSLALRTAHMGAWELNLEDRTLRRSPGHDRIFGYDEPVADWSYERFLEHVLREDRPRVERWFDEVLGQGGEQLLECRIVRRDGRTRWISLTGRVQRDSSGRARTMAGVLQDVTERKQAEEALLAANSRLVEAAERKNEFLAMLSHELRNPLAPIRNSLFVLDRVAPDAPQAARAKAVIDRQVGHLTRLVEDLLDMTRISRGKIQLQPAPVDLDELARNTVEDHRGAFVRAGVELEFRPASGPVPVEADRTRLAQVLGNLLQNAVKFTPKGGRTSVSVEGDRSGGEAVLRVSDTGRGIPAEALPHLFEAFTQAEVTLDRRKGGLGLGLSLVKGLVEMHHGSVEVHSEGIGSGATFTVRLPLRAEPAASAREPGESPGKAPRRVLIVEDNVDSAESLRDLLELHGHEVEIAFNGNDGIEKARSFRPDAIVCDIGLPGMNGYEVARALRSDPELRDIKLIALTGYASSEDLTRSRKAGFDDHLAKPPEVDTLEQMLEQSADETSP